MVAYNTMLQYSLEKYLRSKRAMLRKRYPNIRNKAKRMIACLVNVYWKIK